jgi:hypothetical protein
MILRTPKRPPNCNRVGLIMITPGRYLMHDPLRWPDTKEVSAATVNQYMAADRGATLQYVFYRRAALREEYKAILRELRASRQEADALSAKTIQSVLDGRHRR